MQGGSTITQQLVGLAFLDRTEKSYTRKIKEAVLAIRIEKECSKDEIITHYMNRAYYGGGAYGIEAAAEYFFAKHASELTIPEAAMLAGCIQNPSKWSPIGYPENALKRRNLVPVSYTHLDVYKRQINQPIQDCFVQLRNGRIFPDFSDEPPHIAVGTAQPESSKEKSIEILLKEMDAEEIDYGIVPRRKGAGMFVPNDQLIELMNDYPNHFFTLAALDLAEGMDVIFNEIDKFVVNGPCCDVSLEPGAPMGNHPGRFVDALILWPIYKKCEKNNVTVTFTHSGPAYPDLTGTCLLYTSRCV